MKQLLTLSAPLALLAAVGAAQAEPKKYGHVANVSLSPLHLIFPILRLQGEIYVADSFSVIPGAGIGQITTDIVEDGRKQDVDLMVYEGYLQARGYFYGSTQEGAFGGVVGDYIRIDGEVDGATGIGNGFLVGGFVGYKWVWESGFLIDVMGGLGYLAVQAEAEEDGTKDEEEDSRLSPIINFNLGWAF